MARASEPIDISDNPDLLRLVEEVQANHTPRVLRRDNEDVAIIRPVKRAARTRILKGRPAGADDPLWQLVGAGASEGSDDVATNKHRCLAETHALLLTRLSHAIATAFLRDMEQSFTTVIWATPADVERARELIYRYDDKDFSLTDAASFVVMERAGIPMAFTFDHHFAKYGFGRA